MKQIIFSLLLVTLVSTSCSNQLEQDPNTTKVADSFYSNETELEEAINAVYASLQFTGNFDTAIPAMGELPGEVLMMKHQQMMVVFTVN